MLDDEKGFRKLKNKNDGGEQATRREQRARSEESTCYIMFQRFPALRAQGMAQPILRQ